MQSKTWTGERLETFVFNINTIEHLHRYAIACSLSKNKLVLDIACGEGYGSNLLSKVATGVTGVDISSETVEAAKKKYISSNLSFKEGSASAMPLADRSVDVVVSFETLEHHDQHEEMMKEIKRVLKPGGILVMSSPDKKYYTDLTGYKNPFHAKELYFAEFKNLITRHFNHTSFLLQRLFSGSLIIHESEPKRLSVYSGNYDKLTMVDDFAGVYNICIASDDELPEVGFSVFDGEYISNLFNESRAKALENSWRYRIGNAILSPLNFFRRLR